MKENGHTKKANTMNVRVPSREVLSLPHWGPALRRAVIKVRPEYFTWGREQRERYGASIAEDESTRLEQALCVELFGSGFSRRRKGRLTEHEQNIFNAAILPFTGIGEDSFYLNEYLADDMTVLDFETVRAYDAWDYRNQQTYRKEDNPAWEEKPYRGSLYLSWARLFVDEAFTYATLTMVAGHLFSELQEASADLLQARIPHRYVPGRNHGKVEGVGWEWDQRLEAGGQEDILEALRDRVFAYEQDRFDALLSTWNAAGHGGVYLLDTSEGEENNLHVVFTDPTALERVRFRSFMRDCRAIERPAAELDKAVAEERSALAKFIATAHEEVVRTYDPTLARLRKRMRVMVHKGAFDDLG